MKLLVDMNLSPLCVPFFASHGFASVHWSAIGAPFAPDAAILECAATLSLRTTWISQGSSPLDQQDTLA
jgi:predicted nuclease of predicted toxin-antitoxin system